MTSRRSSRVAAQQVAKPALSYREVNSDDEAATASEQVASVPVKRTRGRKTAQPEKPEPPQPEEEEEEDGVEVIVLDDEDAAEVTAVIDDSNHQQQPVDDDEEASIEEEEAEESEAEESANKTKKRKRTEAASKPTKAKKSTAKRQKGKKKDFAADEDEHMEQHEDDEGEIEKQTEETKPVKGKKKGKAATDKGKKAKAGKGKKAATGKADDAIAVDEDEDGEDDKPKKAKKPAKPKKEKQPSLLPQIRPVTTASSETKKLIGAHVGTSGGVHFGPHNAALMGARCFAMDTRSKRRWASPPYTATVIESFHSHMQHYGYSGKHVLPHGSYLTNLGCLSDELWNKSKACIREELERCEQLGVTNYVFHPGRASTSGEEREEEIRAEKEKKKADREKMREKARDRKKRLKAGEEVSEEDEEETEAISSQMELDPSEYLFKPSTPDAVRSFIKSQPAIRVRSLARLITGLNELLSPSGSKLFPNVHILIETMAGTGNQLCSRFEELRYIIDALDDSSRIGVCLDTCHVFAADERYDMRQRDGYERVMKEAEDIIGWKYIKGMHMNDSKCGSGSRRDRHENIGDGEIGIELFDCVMNDKRWDGIPIVLETPCKTEAKELAKRNKKAQAAGEQAAEVVGGREEEPAEDDENEEDEDDEDGGKKSKGKGKGKGKETAKPKEKEDWVKSYSDEIDMLYGLEGENRRAGKKEEATSVKKEDTESKEEEKGIVGKVIDKVKQAVLKLEGEDEEENEKADVKDEPKVKKEKQKATPKKKAGKKGKKGQIAKEEADDAMADDE